MEQVIHAVAGRPFKLFLQRYTKNPVAAILVGTVVTALIQSSSLVGLMVLAFTGAGIISFRNGLCIIMGSNLGTTFTGWIVATIGFKLDIESWSLPFIASTAILMFFTQRREKLYHTLQIIFSAGILFLGLGFMKAGAQQLVSDIDLSAYQEQGTLFFLIIGFVVTMIIQASSATMAITLTALHANAVTFPAAAAVIIGSEVGTTIKVLMGGLSGNGEKRRTAWGNFIFNIVTALFSIIFLRSLLYFVQHVAAISDPLIALVFFQSLINFLSILIFLPIINPFSRWLEKRFREQQHEAYSLAGTKFPAMYEMAVDTLRHEALLLLGGVADFHIKVLHLEQSQTPKGILQKLKAYLRKTGTTQDAYTRIKQTEGDLLEYYVRVQKHEPGKAEYEKVNQLIEAVRHSVYAAKCIKDIRHNLDECNNSVNNILFDQYQEVRNNWRAFDSNFRKLLAITEPAGLERLLTQSMEQAFLNYAHSRQQFVPYLLDQKVEEVEVSTFMNILRELLASQKSMLRALADIRLGTEASERFKYSPLNKDAGT